MSSNAKPESDSAARRYTEPNGNRRSTDPHGSTDRDSFTESHNAAHSYTRTYTNTYPNVDRNTYSQSLAGDKGH